MLAGELFDAVENDALNADLTELALPPCEPATADRDALIAIYNATGGADWANNDAWLSQYPLYLWHGVRVNERGRVASLGLDGNGLSGEIPPEIGELAHLQILELSGNRLSGAIPSELGELAYLEWITLSGNRIAGCLPNGLLDALREEGLSDLGFPPLCEPLPPSPDRDALIAIYNAAGGARWYDNAFWLSEYPIRMWRGVDTGEEYGGRVIELRLDGNGLVGEIPPEIGALERLQELQLSENRLSGEIPPELGNLTYLVALHIENNALTGEIPPELGSLRHLMDIRIAGNVLTSCIPAALRGRVYEHDFAQAGLPFCEP